MNWEKLGSIRSPRQQEASFEMQILNLWINWEILYPNLSLTVENNMGNSHKKAGHILNLT